jgi:tRNA-dihydrouridine synthase A
MIGREAYENPWSLRDFQTELCGIPAPPLARAGIVAAMADYAAREGVAGVPVRAVARHMLGLFNGLPGARAWRRRLALAQPEDGPGLLLEAARFVAVPEEAAA